MNLNADLNILLSQFYKKIVGKGPKSLKTYFLEDMIIVKFDWYSESILEELGQTKSGREILQNIYRELLKNKKNELKKIVENLLKLKVQKIFFDADAADGREEKVVVFLMEDNIENKI